MSRVRFMSSKLRNISSRVEIIFFVIAFLPHTGKAKKRLHHYNLYKVNQFMYLHFFVGTA